MNAKVIRYDFKAKRRLADNDVSQAPVAPKKSIDQAAQEKCDYFHELINLGKTSVALFPFYPDVQLPEHLMNDPHVVIDWSLRFGIPDFVYDEDGVRGTLSFNREPCFVNLPWASIFMIHHASNRSTGKKWMPELNPALIVKLKQAAEISGLKIAVEDPPKEPNEPIETSSPGMAGDLVDRIFRGARGLANKIFGKRV